MKRPLRIGAFAAPKRQFLERFGQKPTDKARRIASLSAAAAMVVGVGAASAVFVDYLADRALARAAAAPAPAAAQPVAANVMDASVETKVAVLASAVASSEPVQPPQAEITAALPDPEAIAKVAVGPEHAIELPADDPTARPTLNAGKVSAPEAPIAAYAEEADATHTAAIDAAEAVIDQPGKADARRVTRAVNMRSSPKKGAKVLDVVPAGSTVNVFSCDGWCQIAYDGRKGWIYKSFLAR